MKSYQQLWQSLTPLYEAGEAQALVRMVLEIKYGLTLADIICGKVNDLSADKRMELEKITERLQNSEPVQYILGEASFAGRTFHVEPGVLIPRPETAELCQWVSQDEEDMGKKATSLIDICTGSGCIAITLALDLPLATVKAIDISPDALRIARDNARRLGSHVDFCHGDALDLPGEEKKWDVIVSNPPYICEQERRGMSRNVLEHEPGIALFVPDNEPLRFYLPIARYAQTALKPNGSLYFEINPLYADLMQQMLHSLGFNNIETRNDMNGKKRMMKAKKRNK